MVLDLRQARLRGFLIVRRENDCHLVQKKRFWTRRLNYLKVRVWSRSNLDSAHHGFSISPRAFNVVAPSKFSSSFSANTTGAPQSFVVKSCYSYLSFHEISVCQHKFLMFVSPAKIF